MEQNEKPTVKDEKNVFLLKEITTVDAKKQLKRRTVTGQVTALLQTKFKATGYLIDSKGKKKKLEDQTLRGLKENNVGLVKISGVRDFAFALPV